MASYIDNNFIEECIGLDLDITTNEQTIRLTKSFSIGKNDIRISVIFPNYSTEDMIYDFSKDNNLYQVNAIGSAFNGIEEVVERLDAKQLKDFLVDVGRKVFTTKMETKYINVKGVKKFFTNHKQVLTRIIKMPSKKYEDKDGTYALFYDAITGKPVWLSEEIEHISKSQQGDYAITTFDGSLYMFELI